MEDCAFCRIVRGETEAHRVYEDGVTVAFLDAEPAARGHTLVVPREHRASLFSASADATTTVFAAANAVAGALESALEPDGFSLFHTSGDLVGTVDHAHVHLVPRYADDGIHVALTRDALPQDEGAALAARIRERL